MLDLTNPSICHHLSRIIYYDNNVLLPIFLCTFFTVIIIIIYIIMYDIYVHKVLNLY